MTSKPALERVIAAARRTIEEVPFFWVVTPGGRGWRKRADRAGATVIGGRGFLDPLVPHAAEWPESRRNPPRRMCDLGFSARLGEAFVALSGRAELIDDRNAVNSRFRGSSHDDPKGLVIAGLIAVRVIADHLELHIRGVTEEPWGRGRTSLDRDPNGRWRLHPVHYDAPIVR